MRTTIRYTFPTSAADAWEYLIYYKDCEKWLDEKEFKEVSFLFNDEGYAGFQIPPTEPGLQPVIGNVAEIQVGNFVRYHPMYANRENVASDAQEFFPFRSITTSINFEDRSLGCDVITEIEIAPKGIIGWISCLCVIIPTVRFKNHQISKSLANYLAVDRQ